MKTRKKSVKEGRTTNFSWFFFYIDWEQRKLSEYFTKYQNTVYLDDNEKYVQVSVRNTGTVEYRDTKKGCDIGRKRQYMIDTKTYPLTLTFTRQTVYEGGIGFVPESLNGAIVTENMPLLAMNDADKDFIVAFVKTTHYYSRVIDDNTLIGSAQKALHEKLWLNSEVLLPKYSEQGKIGALFRSLESLITLHQRKEFMKKLRKIEELLLKNLANDWEQRKFGETVLIERGGSPRPIDDYITNDAEGLNWVKIGDAPEQGNYITKTAEKIKPSGLSKTREVHPNDLILSNSMSFGKPYIMAINGCIHDGWLLIRDTQEVFDLKFLCHLLGTTQMLSQYKAMAAGSTVNNLNKELVSNTNVMYPKKEEQAVVGKYFEVIDSLITLHQRE